MTLSAKDEALRAKLLTASDMVTLYGASPYEGASAHKVFADKVYPKKERGEMPVPLQLGHLVEPFALKLLKAKYMLTLRTVRTKASKRFPWLGASADALAVETDPENPKKTLSVAPCEAKFVSNQQLAQLWLDAAPNPPLYVVIQLQTQMTVWEAKKGYIVGLVQGAPKFYEVEHDQSLEDEIVAVGADFREQHLLTKKPPAWDGSIAATKLLSRRWPQKDSTFLRATLELHQVARDYLDAEVKIAELSTVQSIAEQKLKEAMGERIGMLGENWKATWKAPKHGNPSWKTIADLLATEMKRPIPTKLIDENRGEATRRFRVYERGSSKEIESDDG